MSSSESRTESPGASLHSLSVRRLQQAEGPFGPKVEAFAKSVFRPGHNVMGAPVRADRAAVLIDGDRYFKAFAEAVAKAEEQILIVAWDTDSRTHLPCPPGFEEAADEDSRRIGAIRLIDLLHEVVRRRPDVRVHVLSWDYRFIYLFEREAMSRLKFALHGERRLRFVFDHRHPALASHHQKIVVIDDQVAFSGGLDITQRRWDTPEHKGYDARRVDPGGHAYGPFHDVQMIVDGEVAQALGHLARERWFDSTGERLEEPPKRATDVWSQSVLPDFSYVDVAISRTIPPKEKRPVREVERLFLDVIERAQAFVYIENQYFTSPRIARAIAKRLREPDGPEFVVVLPRDQTGWIEESTMGLLRSNALRIVESADIFGRWRCFHPVVPGLNDGYVKVHSKVMIADDLFLRVGSANLNGRSMGLDTECDLSLEAGTRIDTRAGIAKIRRELLGEHLGVDPVEFEARFLLNGSLVDTVDSFLGGERTFEELHPTVPPWVGRIAPPRQWLDPSSPYGIRRWFASRLRRHRQIIGASVVLFAALFLFLLRASAAEGGTLIPETHLDFAEGAGKKFSKICEGVRIDAEVGFTDMERRLLCGDGEKNEIGTPWSDIPPNQAAYFMKGFLQSRGFHEPRFIQDGDVLFAIRGPESKVTDFKVTGGPEEWDPPKRRFIDGEKLTPGLLDELQAWSMEQVKNEGYACPTVTSRADPKTGEVRVALTPGPLLRIMSIENTGDTGLRDGVLDRYNAFLIGDLYREKNISLTKRRIQDDGFLQTLVLTARCEHDGVVLTRDVVLGPSRTIRIGVGGSTEEGARVRLIVRRNRIGDSASSAQGRVNVSYLSEIVNRQVADANFRWYYATGENRWFIEPGVVFEHAEEAAYESQSVETKVFHGWSIETTDGQFALRAGPNVLSTFQSRGLGPERATVTYAEFGGRWTAHDFEWFSTSPRAGEYVDATMLVTQKTWGANFTAQKIQLQAQKLWPLFRYDPPLFILGLRFNASAVFSPDDDITADLPVRFLTYLGGESDLRGFDRQSLPRSGVGALSGATGSIEGRFHKVLFKRVDVFTFLDAGSLGRARFKLDPPIFMSPGTGLRWESPIGVLRGYLAQRFVVEKPDNEPDYGHEYRLGFTFGEEF